jgi:hypothetical protein
MLVAEIHPAWLRPVGDRYVSHPHLRIALIQLMDDKEHVYVVTDQALPFDMASARRQVENWRTKDAATEE